MRLACASAQSIDCLLRRPFQDKLLIILPHGLTGSGRGEPCYQAAGHKDSIANVAGEFRVRPPAKIMVETNKNESADWAAAVCVVDRLTRPHQKPTGISDPRLEVQLTLQNVFLSQGPTEIFSQAMPAFVSTTPEEDSLKPIDVLYGRYIPGLRRVEIFVRRIHQDAHLFNCTPSDLLTIVRIHEYAHAACHLGIPLQDIEHHLSDYGASTETDWAAFGNTRDNFFAELDTRCHELLAQAITWSCLTKSNSSESQRLLDGFLAVEAKQAPDYHLTALLKERAPTTNWRLVLDAARGVVDCFRGTTFTMGDGLSSLIAKAAEPAAAVDR